MSTTNIPFSPIITNNDKIDGISKQKGQLLFNIDDHNIYLDESNNKRINIAPTDHAWVTNYKESGDADDTNAFKRALSNNRLVYVPEGEYTLSDTIEIKGNCELQLSQGTVLNFKQANTHCIILHRLARLTGNHATINVPYEFTGHVIHGSIEKDAQLITDYTVAALGASATQKELDEAWKDNMNNVTPPFTGAWDPQWKTARYITDINICKKTSASALQVYLANSEKWSKYIQKTLEEYIKTKVSNYDSLGPAEQEDLQLQYTKEYTDVYCPQLRRNFSNYTDRHSSIAGDTNGVAVYMECKPMFEPNSYERDADGNRTGILKAKPQWASLDQMWGLDFSGLHIAGGFDRGVWFKNISVTYQYRDTDGSIKTGTYDPWNHDARVQGITYGCRVSAEIDTCNNVHLLLTVQPSPSLSDRPASSGYKTYADQGILLKNSRNIDLGQSCVWDWNEWTTKFGGENQHIAMFGDCSGLTAYDYSLVSSKAFWELIYYDNPASMFNSTIIGAKGPLPIDPKYAFYKNFRSGGYAYQCHNLTWRDFHNTTRKEIPVSMQNGWTYPNALYKIGYFVLGGVPESDPASMSDILDTQVLTIEENDHQGLAGWSNIIFKSDNKPENKEHSLNGTLEHFWNPLPSNCEKRAPIYFYTSELGDITNEDNDKFPIYIENPDTGEYDIFDHNKYTYTFTLYRFVPGPQDIMPPYCQKVHMINGRRFIFDFELIGYYDQDDLEEMNDDTWYWHAYDKEESEKQYTTIFKDRVLLKQDKDVFPYKMITPTIDTTDPMIAGQYSVKDGGARVCVQNAMWDELGRENKPAIVQDLAFQEDLTNLVIGQKQRVAAKNLISTGHLKVIPGVYVNEYGDHDKDPLTPELRYFTGAGSQGNPYRPIICIGKDNESQINVLIGCGTNGSLQLADSENHQFYATETFFPSLPEDWGAGFNNDLYKATHDVSTDKKLRLRIKGINFEHSRMDDEDKHWQSHAYGRLFIVYDGPDMVINSNVSTASTDYPLYAAKDNPLKDIENNALYATHRGIVTGQPLHNHAGIQLKAVKLDESGTTIAKEWPIYGKTSNFTTDEKEGLPAYNASKTLYENQSNKAYYFSGFTTDSTKGHLVWDTNDNPYLSEDGKQIYVMMGSIIDTEHEKPMLNSAGAQYTITNTSFKQAPLGFIQVDAYRKYTKGTILVTCNMPASILAQRAEDNILYGTVGGETNSTDIVKYAWNIATKTMDFEIGEAYVGKDYSYWFQGPLVKGYEVEDVSVEVLTDLETYIKSLVGSGGGSTTDLTYASDETEGF